jgi:micrococcal nuclease
MYEYRCEIDRVVDGDTLHLHVDLGLDIYTQATIRLAGINTPEMNTQAGKAARNAAIHWIDDRTAPPSEFTVRTVKDKKEKYGRYLGVLLRDDDPVPLNEWLVNEGHAVPYLT